MEVLYFTLALKVTNLLSNLVPLEVAWSGAKLESKSEDSRQRSKFRREASLLTFGVAPL